MKKKAMTLAEIIIAMTLITSLSIIGITTFKSTIPDTDMVKFKHVYGNISSIISQILANRDLYPSSSGFQDTSSVTIRKTGKTYSGTTKFQSAFREKINILEDDIVINEKNIPLYEDGGKLITANKTTCFTSNSGITFCPPETGKNGQAATRLRKIYLRVHVSDNFGEDSAIYFAIHANGKIDFPSSIPDKFNCMTNSGSKTEREKLNKIYQCAVLASLEKL